MKAGIGFDSEVPSGLKKIMALKDSRMEELDAKLDLVQRLHAAFQETGSAYGQLFLSHINNNHTEPDDCQPVIIRLRDVHEKLANAFLDQYTQFGKLAAVVYGR